MRFERYNPTQLERARLAPDDGLGYCYALSERIRLASEAMTDDDRRAFVRDLLNLLTATRQTARHLSRAETVAFLESPPHLLNGWERLPAGKRGARTKRTHYDLRAARHRGRYHTIKRLPDAGAAARRKMGEPLRAFILRRVEAEARLIPETVPPRKLTGLVSRALSLKGDRFDLKAIRDALRQLGRLKK